jgi:hypothetical protein
MLAQLDKNRSVFLQHAQSALRAALVASFDQSVTLFGRGGFFVEGNAVAVGAIRVSKIVSETVENSAIQRSKLDLLVDTDSQCANHATTSRRRTVRMHVLIGEDHCTNTEHAEDDQVPDRLPLPLTGARAPCLVPWVLLRI